MFPLFAPSCLDLGNLESRSLSRNCEISVNPTSLIQCSRGILEPGDENVGLTISPIEMEDGGEYRFCKKENAF